MEKEKEKIEPDIVELLISVAEWVEAERHERYAKISTGNKVRGKKSAGKRSDG